MKKIKDCWKGILCCLIIAIVCYILGQRYPIIGGPVFGIIMGIISSLFIKNKIPLQSGITFTAKKILQCAVILLGFGLNLNIVLETGRQSFPIIIGTITTSLCIAYVLSRILKIPVKTATLIGVGSSICGGSAIAATAPVIDADNNDVAQAISVIFLFNVIAALFFPILGNLLGFSYTSGDAFGIFAGTAINDTSSVTSAAATWDSMYNLGTATLDKAVTVKLTRTLAIIPITLFLAFFKSKKTQLGNVKFKNIFPFFILFFIGASLITTISTNLGVPSSFFSPLKNLSKFFIIMAMVAIGLNTNIVKLIKSGGLPILLGFSCWIGITTVSLIFQYFLGYL